MEYDHETGLPMPLMPELTATLQKQWNSITDLRHKFEFHLYSVALSNCNPKEFATFRSIVMHIPVHLVVWPHQVLHDETQELSISKVLPCRIHSHLLQEYSDTFLKSTATFMKIIAKSVMIPVHPFVHPFASMNIPTVVEFNLMTRSYK